MTTTKTKFKVAYNASHSGFDLSAAAKRLGRELSGNETWNSDMFELWIPRHDPILIEVIETLGEKANGYSSRLEIVELEGSKYRIDTDNGYESVVEPNEEEWTVIK